MIKFKAMKYSIAFMAILFTSAIASTLRAQELRQIDRQFREHREHHFQEKIYVHTDREFYVCGEIIWFKIYCVEAVDHKPSDVSKVAYVEVIDEARDAVLQAKIELIKGIGSGSLFIPASLNAGKYVIRSYTNWMKNFDPEFYFQKEITIVNTFRSLADGHEAKKLPPPDVQFFPEGGRLIAGLQSKVAFKATDASGTGFPFYGALYNDLGDTLLSFRPARVGIGHFNFTPEQGRQYKAMVRTENGDSFVYDMPETLPHGYTLALAAGIDQLTVKIRSNQKVAGDLYLLVHCRQKFVQSQLLKFDGESLEVAVKQAALGDGINHFTLFDSNRQPVCERLYFKKPETQLVIESDIRQAPYGNRQQVVFDLNVSGRTGIPLAANLSMSVYKLDSLNEISHHSIANYLMLTADLKGKIESPEFYFQQNVPDREMHLDNLMLTHGWRRFAWKEVLDPQEREFEYLPEYRGHIITAKVSTGENESPIVNKHALLSIPGKFVNATVAKSDAQGLLQFEVQNYYGNKPVHLSGIKEEDSIFHFEIVRPFSGKFSDFPFAEMKISPDREEALLSRNIGMQTRNVYFDKELNKFSPPRDTTSFYRPSKTYYLDIYTRFTTMEDVMREYVREVWVRVKDGKFRFMVFDEVNKDVYKENPVLFYDGIPVFTINRIMDVDPLKVRKMDIMAGVYSLGPLTFKGIVSYLTYKGDMDGLKFNSSNNFIAYEGMQLQREFYQPLYEGNASELARLPDYRNLLYWNPNITTDNTGKAQVAFYTSDLEGTYAVVVEGITVNGLPGTAVRYLTVNKEIN